MEDPVDDSDAAEPKSEDLFTPEDEKRHPLLEQATEFLAQLHVVFRGADARFEASLHTLFTGAGDMVGGLAQALSDRAEDPDDGGLCVIQSKRALRSAAFVHGALFSLRPAAAQQFEELIRTVEQLQKHIIHELRHVRSK